MHTEAGLPDVSELASLAYASETADMLSESTTSPMATITETMYSSSESTTSPMTTITETMYSSAESTTSPTTTITETLSVDPAASSDFPGASSPVPANTTIPGRALFAEMASIYHQLDVVRAFFNQTSATPPDSDSNAANATRQAMLGLLDEIAVRYHLQHCYNLTSELPQNDTQYHVRVLNTTSPAERRLLLNAVTFLIVHRGAGVSSRNRDLEKSRTEIDLQRAENLILNEGFQATPTQKKTILEGLIVGTLHNDKQSPAEKTAHDEVIATVISTLTHPQVQENASRTDTMDSTTIPAQPSQNATATNVLHEFYNNLISSVLTSNARAGAEGRAQVTAVVAARLAAIVEEIRERQVPTEEGESALHMAALTAIALRRLEEAGAMHDHNSTQPSTSAAQPNDTVPKTFSAVARRALSVLATKLGWAGHSV